MNKTKSKVLSLILASAMIVSSFSSLNFASAASRTETGDLTLSTGADILRNSDNEIYLVSQTSKTATADLVPVDHVFGAATIDTYDNDSTSEVEFVSASHVSGDKIISVEKKDGDYYVAVRANASGKEVVNVRYEATYERDDKEVTVKANKDVTIYSDKAGEVFLGEADAKDANGSVYAIGTTSVGERPGAVPTAAVNQKYLDIGMYYAESANASGDSWDKIQAAYAGVDVTSVTKDGSTKVYTKVDADNNNAVIVDEDSLDLKSSKIFDHIVVQSNTTWNGSALAPVADTYLNGVDGTQISRNTIRLVTDFEKQTAKADPADERSTSAKLLSVGNNTLEIKLGEVQADGTQYTDLDRSQQNIKVYSEKKYNLDLDLNDGITKLTSPSTIEINKKNGKTYAANAASVDWDDSDNFKADQKKLTAAVAVNNYDKLTTDRDVKVIGGSIGNLEAGSVTVEDGTVGDIKIADGAGTVYIEGGTVGTILKNDSATGKITIEDGKIKAIDRKYAVVEISGGEVTGNIVADTIDIDAADDDINTVIGGDVTAKNATPDITIDASSDATVTVKGTIKGIVTASGDNVTLGNIDLDYEYDANFEDFTGTIKAIVNAGDDSTLTLDGESAITLGGKLTVDSVEIDEDSKLTVAEASVGSISGDGIFAFPAGKLYVSGGIDDVTKLVITSGLEVNATAFTSEEDAVDGSDLNTIGYTLTTKSASSTTDKHVITAVKFAGVQFDKTSLTIAKGFSDTLTVKNYPDGTALPAGYTVEWNVDVNDDYITVTTEGNVATVKAVDYSSDRAVDNQGTITATVVDEDGYEVEDLLTASINVTAIEKPASVVTLDTTKPVTVGTGAVYQYIAKSSTGAVMTATSSDTQIATVELFNAADPRGYKFQVKGVAEGTATITTTDANGATATLTVNVTKVNGTLKADTTTYTFAPGAIYDVKFSTTGTTAVPVVTVNGKVVSIAPRGNGVYRVTAQNAGTAFVVATVGNTHVSVKFVVAPGAVKSGVTGNNVSILK